jgi:non-specific protein-tyrosine kinase
MLRAPESPAANAYRMVLSSLQGADGQGARGRYLVAAVDQTANGAVAVANLGIAAAASGIRTLIVDADLRHPRLHALLGTSNERGVSAPGAGAEAGACLQSTAVAGLMVLPAGPAIPVAADTLASPALSESLRDTTGDAELVLVSSAPLSDGPDGFVVARWVDGTILVLGANRTRREVAVWAREQLERAGARVVGAVLQGGTR